MAAVAYATRMHSGVTLTLTALFVVVIIVTLVVSIVSMSTETAARAAGKGRRKKGKRRDNASHAVSGTPELRRERVLLVPARPEHAAELRRMLHTREVWRWWGDDDSDPARPFDDPETTRFR